MTPLPTAYELGLNRPDWTLDALCSSIVDDEIWFPPKGGSTNPAKRICSGCPVRAECLQFGIEADDQFGVYGGLSVKERIRLTAAGWRPGDTLPDVQLQARPRQPCDRCHGQEYVNLTQHIIRAHGYLNVAEPRAEAS